jgi:hypothetical protein
MSKRGALSSARPIRPISLKPLDSRMPRNKSQRETESNSPARARAAFGSYFGTCLLSAAIVEKQYRKAVLHLYCTIPCQIWGQQTSYARRVGLTWSWPYPTSMRRAWPSGTSGPRFGLLIPNGPDRAGTIADLYEGQDLPDALVELMTGPP